MNRNWWEEATPEGWYKLRDYFWPAKGAALAKLSTRERKHLPYGYDREGYDDDSD